MTFQTFNLASLSKPTVFDTTPTLADLCRLRLEETPTREFLSFNGDPWTVERLVGRACDFSPALQAVGVGKGDFVAVMLNNHPDHVAVILALGLVGAVWVPLDRRFRPANVLRVLEQVPVSLVIADNEYRSTLTQSGNANEVFAPEDVRVSSGSFEPLTASEILSADTRALLFTSGSTGPPKGVVVTENMYIASGVLCAIAGDADQEQTFYVWEPLNHIGGAQLIPMALLTGARLALTERFSVSRFWPEVVDAGATRLHYLGGVIDLLLQQPAGPLDQAHLVALGFGAGARIAASEQFTARFGVPLREVYGMTEASSFTTINFNSIPGSIGQPLPCFDLKLLDEHGHKVANYCVGEITLVAPDHALITGEYFKNPDATIRAFKNGRFHTGDLARMDSNGNLNFVGRSKETIRCKGENISPWEIETALRAHPQVAEVAVVGADIGVGEQEIVAFLKLSEYRGLDETEVESLDKGDIDHSRLAGGIIDFVKRDLTSFQLPRFLLFVDTFPKTPSERIEKHKLDISPKALRMAWDRLAEK